MREIVREVEGLTIAFGNTRGVVAIEFRDDRVCKASPAQWLAVAEMIQEFYDIKPALFRIEAQAPPPCPDCATREAHRARYAEHEEPASMGILRQLSRPL